MTELLSHLEIGSSCGGCMTELVSTCRVMNHLDEVGGCCNDHDDGSCVSKWKINDCEDCCCGSLDPQAQLSDAPWYDPQVPASADFLGLHGALTLASPPNVTSVSSDGATTAAIPKQITFIGAIIARSRAGVVFGEQWVERQLLPDCPACSGRPVRFYLHCQDTTGGAVETPQPGQVVPDPLVGWDEPCGGCGCDDYDPDAAERLLPASQPTRDDNGGRDLLRVRYNPGSFQQLPTEDGPPIPSCIGKRVTFSFTVLESNQYLDTIEACVIDAETNPIDLERCFTATWIEQPDEPVVVGKPGCEPPPSTAITTEDRHTTSYADEYGEKCKFSAPLSTVRVACLTPHFPGDEADMIVTIDGGDTGACNVAVTFWESAVGWPHPANPAGRATYPLASAVGRAEIPWLPPGEPITLDGRTSAGTPGVTGCQGSVYRQPSIPCGRRYWVAVDFDCFNPPGEGWQIKVEVAPKERVTG